MDDHRAFINFTEGLLNPEYEAFFPRRHIVIEVLESVVVTPQLISSLQHLKQKGFVIALDDYVFNPALEVLEDYADIIKVDILQVGPKPLIENAAKLRAKFCELVGSRLRESSVDTYFTVGLFSSLDAVMDTEMKSLLDKMNLCQEVKLALLQRQGKLGVVLDAVCGIKKGATDFALPQGVSGKELSTLYLQAMRFAEEAKLF